MFVLYGFYGFQEINHVLSFKNMNYWNLETLIHENLLYHRIKFQELCYQYFIYSMPFRQFVFVSRKLVSTNRNYLNKYFTFTLQLCLPTFLIVGKCQFHFAVYKCFRLIYYYYTSKGYQLFLSHFAINQILTHLNYIALISQT